MTLQQIFERHGTDKAAHGYAAVYEKLPPPARMLEVGVFKGASLRAWREWWPEAHIYGIDTFERGFLPMMLDANMWTFRADVRTWQPPNDLSLDKWIDLIIDDGSHRPRDQAATLRNLWPLLAPGGTYFIEDVWPMDLMCENSERHPWLKKHAEHFTMAAFLELANALEETGGKMTRHDFRAQSGKPDSVLVEIRKP